MVGTNVQHSGLAPARSRAEQVHVPLPPLTMVRMIDANHVKTTPIHQSKENSRNDYERSPKYTSLVTR